MKGKTKERRRRRGLVVKLAPLVLLLMPLSFDCICADAARNLAAQDALEEQVDAYEHAATSDAVQAAARRAIPELANAERRSGRSGAVRLVSPWVFEQPGRGSCLVLEIREGRRGRHVELHRHSRSLQPRSWRLVSTERDQELEFELLERGTRADVPPTLDGNGTLTFHQSSTMVWFDLVDGLRRRGERLPAVEPPAPGGTVETELVGEAEAAERVRHRLAFAPGQGEVRVTIVRLRERTDDEPRWETRDEGRDRDEELRIIEDLDPAGAERIRSEARRAGQEAYERARDRGALTCAGCNDACRGCTRELGRTYDPGCQGCDCRSCE